MSENRWDSEGCYFDRGSELDGQEYQPSPQIVPDTRTGFDSNGDYHTNPAGMDTPHTPNLPYRLAAQMQERIVQQVSTEEYTVGRAERDDRAIEIANEWFNGRVFEPADVAFEALNYWRRIYGRGVQG